MPEAPGRVVTLIEHSFWKTLDDEVSISEKSHENQTHLIKHSNKEDDKVWGVAYHIIPERVQEVREYLDIREINGYSIQHTPFHPADSIRKEINCLVYIGMPDNPQFLGRLDPQDVAVTINQSRGPSGENREYLFNLETALLALSEQSEDGHITDLATRVRSLKPTSRSKP